MPHHYYIAAIIIVFLLYALLIHWYTKGIKKTLLRPQTHAPNPPHIFISIIIAMRNEAHNIQHCLNSLSAQTHKNYEIILINDHSTDDTYNIAHAHAHPRLTIINAQNTGKKAAIAQGIAIAQGTHIAITDADCTPPPNWLHCIARAFMQNNDIQLISAPVRLVAHTNNFFEQLQALEFAGLNAIGAASIYHRQPNMCNGANLSYRRTAFDAVGGFDDNIHLASGDDEFLMHKIHAHYGTNSVYFLADAHAIVATPVIDDCVQFFYQRKRWASKSGAYKNPTIIMQMLLVFVVNCSVVLSLIMGYWQIAALQIITKYWIEYYFYAHLAHFYTFKKWRILLFFGQFIQIPYLIIIALATLHKGYEWKNRSVQ